MRNSNILLAILASYIISSCASLPGYSDNTKTNQWMNQNKNAIANKSLTQITIPGSYAANSYAITTTSPICHGEMLSNNNNAQIYRLLSQNESISLVQKAQIFRNNNNDIRTQLEQGVRYLEIPLCLEESQIFTSNLYITDTFDKVNQQILDFLNQHPNEIIIIDLSDIWDDNGYASTKNIEKVYQQIISTYNKLLIKKSTTNSFNINNLMQKYGRIMLISNQQALTKTDEVWNKNSLFNEISPKHWATIKKLTNLQIALETQEENSSANKFTITPIYSLFDPEITSAEEINDKSNDGLVADYLFSLPESADFNIIVSDGRHIEAVSKFATRNFVN